MSSKFSNKHYSQAGFTMVELAICLLIIGLIIGSVLRANELIDIVKARRMISDTNAIMAAVKGFQDKYGGSPGDFASASAQIGGCEPGNVNTCFNGDGNSMIGCVRPNCGLVDSGWQMIQTGTAIPQRETTLFWKHLALAGFIKGVNPAANIGNPEWGQTHPTSPMGGGLEIFTDTEAAGSAISIRARRALGPTDGVWPTGHGLFMTAKLARYIDEKYDDGKPGAGFYWAIPPASQAQGGCRISTNDYNPDLQDVPNSCAYHIIIH